MATLGQILDVHYRGAAYAHLEDSADLPTAYATLDWVDTVIAKPSLDDLIALNGATDAALAEAAKVTKQQDVLLSLSPDALLWVTETLVGVLRELATKVVIKDGETLDPTALARLDLLHQKLVDARKLGT